MIAESGTVFNGADRLAARRARSGIFLRPVVQSQRWPECDPTRVPGRDAVEFPFEEEPITGIRDIAHGRVVVVGVGNTLKADDGAGSLLAQKLKGRFQDVVIDAAGVPENYLGPVRRAEPETIIIVDAADFDGEPGEIRIVAGDDVGGFPGGTHATPLSLFMMVVSEETGAGVHLVVIQATTTEFGGDMSPEVASAVERLAQELTEILERRDNE
jgi:hydrogenase 3 maturation protease